MSDLKSFYKTIRELLQAEGYEELASFCNEDCMSDYVVDHDNWNGGTDVYNIDLEVPVGFYHKWDATETVKELEKQIETAFETATKGISSIQIAQVTIRPSGDVEQKSKKRSYLRYNLHFEVQTKQGQRSDYIESVRQPSQYPCFILVFNDDWNDYGYHTWFSLFYFKSKTDRHKIGELKLMCSNHESTMDALPEMFEEPLDDSFCSLGIDSNYYINLNRILAEESLIKEVQHFLCDCTFDPSIYEKHQNQLPFKASLMRDMSSIDAFNEGQALAMGIEPDKMYSFNYVYHPKQNENLFAEWNVCLHYNSLDFMRTIGIIGNNGVGKTQILSKFVSDLLQHNAENFNELPHFKSLQVICSTPFDKYPDDSQDIKEMKYKRCSLEQDRIRTIELLISNVREIQRRPTVDTKAMLTLWREMSERYVNKQFVDNVTCIKQNEFGEDYVEVKWDELGRKVEILSSGQLHILSLVTYICANIHYRSLLIIDEPEVHLHPHIMMEFILMLSGLLTLFKSYAIIATHSPLIVREMVGTNVFLMQKMQDEIPQIAPVAFETLGEDVTVLYRNLFGYDEKESFFKNIVDELCQNGKSYDDIVGYFERKVKLSVNAMLIIRDAIQARDNAQV